MSETARLYELLWRQSSATPKRGPKPRVTLDIVVATAISIADADGMSAVTIRSVGAAVDLSAMAVYSYVPGKSELLCLMLDQIYLNMARPVLTGLSWRDRVRSIADSNRELLRRHPWAGKLTATRPPAGPGRVEKYDYELGAFDDQGLDDVTMDAALTLLLGFVTSVAGIDGSRHSRDLATVEDGTWEMVAPLVAHRDGGVGANLPSRRLLASRLDGGAGSAEGAYEFGIARLLDGLARLIELR